jgi:hypothetical protein
LQLRLVVASLYHQALSSLRTVLVGGGRGHGATMQTEKQGGNIATPEQLAARIRELREQCLRVVASRQLCDQRFLNNELMNLSHKIRGTKSQAHQHL